jgi:hypothetical protein
MLKFIPGILILQVITIALVWITPGELENWGWLRLAIPVLIAGFLTAFWFGSIAAHQRTDKIRRLKEEHAKEREKIRLSAEREKTRVEKQAQRKTRKEIRRSTSKSNIRLGLAFTVVAGMGGVLLLTQFMSLGLLMLSALGGTLGGYILRIRQEKRKDSTQVINVTSQDRKQLRQQEPP